MIIWIYCSPSKYDDALWGPIAHGKLLCFLHRKALNCLLATLEHIFHSSQTTFAKAVFWNYNCGFEIVPWGLKHINSCFSFFLFFLNCYNHLGRLPIRHWVAPLIVASLCKDDVASQPHEVVILFYHQKVKLYIYKLVVLQWLQFCCSLILNSD